MSDAHSLYERLGFVVMSGMMTAKQNKKGEWKKQFGFQSGWEKKTSKEYNKKASGFAILTGKASGCSVIDIDDPECEHNKELMELMSECNLVAETKHGFHYVFKYDDRIVQTTGDKLDVRNDGGCIFCEPSVCRDDKGNTVAEYHWIKQPFEDEGLVSLPDEVVEFLTKLDARYVGGVKNVVEEQEEVQVPMVEETASETTTASEPRNENDGLLVKVVEALPVKCLDLYSDWIRIGMIFNHEKYTCDQWDAVSKRSKNYEKGACEKHWASFQKDKGRKLSGATLWKMLKTENQNAFWGLMENRMDFWNLIALINHKDIAKYFYNINPDGYLWCETLGWYTLTKSNIWKHYDKSQPSGLKRHIADTLQDLTMDTKKAELATYAKESAKITDQDKQKERLKEHQSKIKNIHDAYRTFGTSDFCNGVIAFLPSFYELDDLEAKIDMNRYLYAFTDGVFDLNTCAFRMLTPLDYVSTTCGYAYPKKSNPDIRTKVKAFLYGLFENKETEDYFLKVIASCLYGGNRWEEFYGFTGTGGNGKGVVADLLKVVFGDYYHSVDNTLFTKPLERKDQPIPALVEARCKRIMMTTEPETDDKLQGGLLKKISGGDPVEARTLHSKHIVKYVPQFKVFLQMNNIPKMSKIDGGIERRMRIIQFPFKFVAQDKMTETYHRLGDPDVKERHCKSDAWRDEFCLMLTETYKSIKDLKSLKQPKTVSDATCDYLDDNNPLKVWLNTHYNITKDENHKIGSAELKRAYLEDTHIDKIADASFKSLLEFNGVARKREACGIVYVGIKRKEIVLEV